MRTRFYLPKVEKASGELSLLQALLTAVLDGQIITAWIASVDAVALPSAHFVSEITC